MEGQSHSVVENSLRLGIVLAYLECSNVGLGGSRLVS